MNNTKEINALAHHRSGVLAAIAALHQGLNWTELLIQKDMGLDAMQKENAHLYRALIDAEQFIRKADLAKFRKWQKKTGTWSLKAHEKMPGKRN